MSKHETFLDAAEDFMEKYVWDVFCTPTWRYPVGEDRAKRDVREFVSKFGEQAYGYVKSERGPQGGRIHAHAAIGGLNPIAKNRGDQLWPYGIIHWEPYRRGGGAARYLWKNAEEVPGQFIGATPRRVCSRKRGRRGRGGKKGKIRGLANRAQPGGQL